MEISIIEATDRPIDVISRAAGTSYDKNDCSPKRVKNCVIMGHDSVLEHASVTFRVSGISRACSHQLVRHRMASFCQLSQRYVKVDTETDWYVIPPEFEGKHVHEFKDHMDACAIQYNAALGAGMKPEDARYLLPEATKTRITVTMNVRELFHFFDLRLDRNAQWEIKRLARELLSGLRVYNSQWSDLMVLYSERSSSKLVN